IARVNTRWGDQYRVRVEAERAKKFGEGAQNNPMGEVSAMPSAAAPKVPASKLSEAAPSPADARLNDNISEANKDGRRAAEITEDLIKLRERLAVTTEEGGKKAVATAIRVNEAELANIHERGDTSWLQKQEAAVGKITNAIVMSAKKSKEATESKLAAEIKFWGETAHNAEFSVTQRAAAEHKLTGFVEQQKLAQLRAAEAGAKSGTSAEIAELSAQQAAHHDDFTKWMELENQKLAILRAAHGEKSREYQSELRAMENFQREHEARMQAIELQRLTKDAEIGQKALQEKIQRLAAEVAAQQLTKSDELDAARTATELEGFAELQHLDDFIAKLTRGTTEFDRAMQQRASLAQTFATKLAAIDTQMAAEERRSADRRMATYASAFDRIGSTGERTVTGLITGTTNWRQAQQHAAGAVLEGMVSVGGKILSNWAAVELGKLISTQTGQQARNAVEMTGSGWSVIGHKLAEWIGLETAKTEAVVVGSATRTGVAAGADVATGGSGVAGATTATVAGASAARAGAYAAPAPIRF
ncbi:MAG: hypothetical protein H7251_09250, partial [Acetobacteraceae bacterium]|nr:hypothetical protein [Acetobacteraceae bacterium]